MKKILSITLISVVSFSICLSSTETDYEDFRFFVIKNYTYVSNNRDVCEYEMVPLIINVGEDGFIKSQRLLGKSKQFDNKSFTFLTRYRFKTAKNKDLIFFISLNQDLICKTGDQISPDSLIVKHFTELDKLKQLYKDAEFNYRPITIKMYPSQHRE